MGLGPTATEGGVRSWLSGFGPVHDVAFVRDGNAVPPLAIVEMDIANGQTGIRNFFLWMSKEISRTINCGRFEMISTL
jgi:hypothetical protein